MKIWNLPLLIALILGNQMSEGNLAAASPQVVSERAIALGRQIDSGKAEKEAIDQDMYAVWNTFRDHMANFNESFEHKICKQPEDLEELIDKMEKVRNKVQMAWDLKQIQLKSLMEILTHENYTITGLDSGNDGKDDNEDVISACKGLSDYITKANQTAIDEKKELDRHRQEIADFEMQFQRHPCPCEWGHWGTWSDCTVKCGGGSKERKRTVARESTNGGKACGHGDNTQSKGCQHNPCPIDCKWQPWLEWGDCPSCPAPHNVQNATRTRTKMVEAQHGGKKCDGEDFDVRKCTQEAELSEKIKSLVDKEKQLNEKIDQLEGDKAKLEKDNKRMQEVIQNCGDENQETCDVEIKVLDLMTGKGLAEADVIFKHGAEAEESKKTRADGTLSLGQVELGTEISITVKKDQFSDQDTQVIVGESTCGKTLPIGIYKVGTLNTIVLQWKEDPQEVPQEEPTWSVLDLHLLNPTCGVSYMQKTTNEDCTTDEDKKNSLLVDSYSGGPYTISIGYFGEKGTTYRIAVHAYDYDYDSANAIDGDEQPMCDLDAEIQIVTNSGDRKTFKAPACNDENKDKKWWFVGCFNGDSKLDGFQFHNEMRDEEPDVSLC